MTVLKRVFLGLIAVAVVSALVGVILAVRAGSDTGQKNATLFVASMALLVTVLKVFLDLVFTPVDEAYRERLKRAEERTESAAAEVKGYFGVLGSQLLGQLEDSWNERDARWVEDLAGYLASMAEKCYEIAERAPDKLAILIGVVWLSAQEVSNAACELRRLAPEQWEEHPAAKALQTTKEYYRRVEDRLHAIIAPQFAGQEIPEE